jgi:hypothetical protein
MVLPPDVVLVRLVTSFVTTVEQVEHFITTARES